MIPASVVRDNERYLFELAYRLTGSAADADDVVQETFTRAVERPPADTSREWRPWLVRVAVNVGRDLLRRRRRAKYPGEWLPSALETDGIAADERFAPEARFSRLESATAAFLRAVEVLTPKARAVLILRDAFGYSVRETADALTISEPDVKTTLHRARRALAVRDEERRPPSEEEQRLTEAALGRLLAALAAEDLAAVEACLADSVRATTDAGGEFSAVATSMDGRSRVARLFHGLSRKGKSTNPRFEVRSVNGLPALVVVRETRKPRLAPRFVLRVEVDPAGRITLLETLLATRKLAKVRSPS